MSTRLSDYHIFTGFYISDPRTVDSATIQQEINEIRLYSPEKLESHLEKTLEEIETIPLEKIGIFALQGLIRGACCAAGLLKTRVRRAKRRRQNLSKIFGGKATINACSQLIRQLAEHKHAPDCVKKAAFSHTSFLKEIRQVSESFRQEQVDLNQLKKRTNTTWKVDSKNYTNAAYLPI